MKSIAHALADHVRAEGMPPKGTTLYELMRLVGIDIDDDAAEFSADAQEVAEDCLDVMVAGNEVLDELTKDLFLELMRAMAGDEPETATTVADMRAKLLDRIADATVGMDVRDIVSMLTADLAIAGLGRVQERLDAVAGTQDGAKMLDEPISVSGFSSKGTPALREKMLFGGGCGDMVAIRPVGDEFEDRTHLGVIIGEIARGVTVGRRKSDDVLVYDMGWHNPAIFVPDLNRVIFGSASWWGRIRDESHLREITDGDIENVWYVRALKALGERRNDEE